MAGSGKGVLVIISLLAPDSWRHCCQISNHVVSHSILTAAALPRPISLTLLFGLFRDTAPWGGGRLVAVSSGVGRGGGGEGGKREEEEGRRRRREREEAERGDLRRWEGVDPDCGRHDTTGQRSRNSLSALSLTIGIFEKDLTAAESLQCESRPQRKR